MKQAAQNKDFSKKAPGGWVHVLATDAISNRASTTYFPVSAAPDSFTYAALSVPLRVAIGSSVG